MWGGLAGAPGAQEHPWEPLTQLLAHPPPSPGGSRVCTGPSMVGPALQSSQVSPGAGTVSCCGSEARPPAGAGGGGSV